MTQRDWYIVKFCDQTQNCFRITRQFGRVDSGPLSWSYYILVWKVKNGEKNGLVNRNVFSWPTRMLIQEYVLLGKFTVLPHSTTALTISLFILAQ